MTPQHHGPGGGFRNPWPGGELHGLLSLLKWRLRRLVDPPPPDPDPATMPRGTPAFARPRAALDRLTITWVGHATFLIQMEGLNVLSDPMWSGRASPVRFAGPRRLVAPGIRFPDLPPIDVVLQSHNHYDHLDDWTVRRLAQRHPDATWIVPLGVRSFLTGRGVRTVHELDWWDEVQVGSLAVTATPAQHFSGRGLTDRNRTLWCGFVCSGGARRLYFAGDTGYCAAFGEIERRCGPFDVALLPVGAYEPRWFMRPVHMNPEEAVQACLELGAALAGTAFVPMHWGTFRLTDEPVLEPPVRALAAWRSVGMPEERFWQLAHGATRAL